MKGGWMVGYIHCVPRLPASSRPFADTRLKKFISKISDFNMTKIPLHVLLPLNICSSPKWKSKFVFRAHKWSRQKKTGTTAFYHYHYQGSQFIWIIAMITNLITGDGNDSGAHCRRAHCAGIGQWSSVANQSAFPLNLFHLCCPSVAGFLGSDSFVCEMTA